MKCDVYLLCALALGVAACSAPRYGSVGEQTAKEALSSPALALTPRLPGWLLSKKQVFPLSAEQAEAVRRILQPQKLRTVPEAYYRSESRGNRGDDSSRIFYLYAANGQCLGGRVVGESVLMDDFELSRQESLELYTLLLPVLRRIFPGGLPS